MIKEFVVQLDGEPERFHDVHQGTVIGGGFAAIGINVCIAADVSANAGKVSMHLGFDQPQLGFLSRDFFIQISYFLQ